MTKIMFRPLVAAALVAFGMVSVAHAEPPAGAKDRRGPPSPERMVEHAMTFDADADGKLDRAELTKFAEEMQAMRMRGGPGGPGGGGRGKGGQGAGRGPGRRGPGDPSGDGERPQPPTE
ncbi:MAG: hypothetical protein ACK54F_00235 [Planctomycetia bacterium]